MDINVINNKETLNYILNNRCSVARFGDGEIDIIAGASIPYQQYDEKLANKLREIISLESDEKFLVCLPDVFEKTERYNDFAMNFWRGHLSHYSELYKNIVTSSWYGSTFLSRPYIDLKDKSTLGTYFDDLRTLWQGRDILIVEGETSRSGVGNDLFNEASSIKRIICPSKNAFSHYDWIEQQIRKHGKNKLVLLMLGPTAKVLSYNLAKEGYWLVDLGHIDSEYEWYKMGATEKVKLNNKHTAEFNYDTDIVFDDDIIYKEQIVCHFNESVMNVAFSINDNYAKHIPTVVYSLSKNNSDFKINVYILYQNISNDKLENLRLLEEKLPNINIIFKYIDDPRINSLEQGDYHLPRESYFRMILADVVDEDRILYLDVDTVVLDSIADFYFLDFENNYMAVIEETYVRLIEEHRYAKLGLDSSKHNYFNSGVLLMNLALLRQNNITDKLIDFTIKNHEGLDWGDQDILNMFFAENILLVDEKYNYNHDLLLNRNYMEEEKTILHFSGSHITKPWYSIAKMADYLKPAADIYRNYKKEINNILGNDQEQISIVVVAKEAENNIEECLDSIISQTYYNLEIIVAIDGNDKTLEICQKFENSYDFIKIMNLETENLAILRHRAIHSTTSNYITIVDGRDVLAEDYIEILCSIAKKHDVEMVSTAYYIYNSLDGIFYYNTADSGNINIFSKEQLLEKQVSNDTFRTILGKLYKKELLESIYISEFNLSDQYLIERMSERINNIAYVEKNSYLFRKMEDRDIPSYSMSNQEHGEDDVISVIVPVYNVEQYLEECIDSILSQSYKNLEILLIDDGSTDSSLAICEKYAEKDSRIRVFVKENGGSADAKNYGMDLATGKYILFVDSDDCIRSHQVAVLYQQIKKYDADMSIGNYMNFYQDNGSFGYYTLDASFVIEEITSQQAIDRQVDWGALNASCYILPTFKLIKKEISDNIRFPVGRRFDDEGTMHKFYIAAKKIILVNDSLYIYRHRAESTMTSSFNASWSKDLLAIFDMKISDIAIAGYSIKHPIRRYIKVLEEYKYMMENYGLTADVNYKAILYRLENIKNRF